MSHYDINWLLNNDFMEYRSSRLFHYSFFPEDDSATSMFIEVVHLHGKWHAAIFDRTSPENYDVFKISEEMEDIGIRNAWKVDAPYCKALGYSTGQDSAKEAIEMAIQDSFERIETARKSLEQFKKRMEVKDK